MKVYLDEDCLLLNTWNHSYGNKIAHLLYVVNFCDKHDLDMGISENSVLDELFELSKFKTKLYPKSTGYSESLGFKIVNIRRVNSFLNRVYTKYPFLAIRKQKLRNRAYKYSQLQFEKSINFLESKVNDKGDFNIKGHFLHHQLMPEKSVFDKYLKVKPELIKKITEKYPDLKSTSAVAVHFRNTDFGMHQKFLYPKSVVLPKSYYTKAIAEVKKAITSPIFHLFSDDHDTIKEIFKNEDFVLHKGSAPEDWMSIFLSSNVIQSNSSFCWTASLYNKTLNIQPAGGMSYNHYEGHNTPYGFIMDRSKLIYNDK